MDNISLDSDFWSYLEPLDPQILPVLEFPDFESTIFSFETETQHEHLDSDIQAIDDLFDFVLGTRTASEAGLPEPTSTTSYSNPYFINKQKPNQPYSKPSAKKIKRIFPDAYNSLKTKDIDKLKTEIPQLVSKESFLEIALHFSIRKNWAEGVQLLLDNHANPNWIDPNSGSSAINCSRYASHSKIFFSLLHAGANLSAINKKNMTVLHFAASFGPLNVVERICEIAPQIIGIESNQKKIPLELAQKKDINTKSNRKAVVNYLSGRLYERKKFSAPLQIQKRKTVTQKYSLKKDKASLLKKIDSLSVENKQEYLNNYLHQAINQRWPEGVEVLLKNGASANSLNPNSLSTPLQSAIYACYSSIINPLLDYGAEVGELPNQNSTILHLAVKFCPSNIILKMLEINRTMFSKTDSTGQTPLHILLLRKRPIGEKVLIEFLKFIDDPVIFEVKDINGNRPIDLCTKEQHKNALLQRITQLNKENSFN